MTSMRESERKRTSKPVATRGPHAVRSKDRGPLARNSSPANATGCQPDSRGDQAIQEMIGNVSWEPHEERSIAHDRCLKDSAKDQNVLVLHDTEPIGQDWKTFSSMTVN